LIVVVGQGDGQGEGGPRGYCHLDSFGNIAIALGFYKPISYQIIDVFAPDRGSFLLESRLFMNVYSFLCTKVLDLITGGHQGFLLGVLTVLESGRSTPGNNSLYGFCGIVHGKLISPDSHAALIHRDIATVYRDAQSIVAYRTVGSYFDGLFCIIG
jgi:hypothetical protein